GHGAQPEPLRRVERGALDPAVVEGDAFRLAVFEEQLAVIHAGQRLADKLLDPALILHGAVEKEVVGDSDIAHDGSVSGIASVLARNMVAASRRRKTAVVADAPIQPVFRFCGGLPQRLSGDPTELSPRGALVYGPARLPLP